MLYVLWGTAKGAQSWEEDVIVETEDGVKLQKAMAFAKAKGFTNLRVLKLDGKKPDFIGALNL